MSHIMPTTNGRRRLQPRGWIGHGVVLTLLLGRVAGAQSHPSELRKVHALLVIDTLSGLGDSVKVDGERVDHLMSGRLPKDRAEILVLTGKDVNANAILSYYRGLKVGRDDALFFYYAGHGATDPQKGQFLALQELDTKPLLRSDLRRAMQERQPGLVVIMTDCCSTTFTLSKTRRILPDKGTAATIDPLLRCLLYRSRGVVDITAASGNSSFGDDHDGGIFTRTFAKLVEDGITGSDANKDGFVSWPEFFSQLQKRTQGVFVTWADKQRARGEDVDQTSQKPMAFSLGTEGETRVVRLHNMTAALMEYEYRWAGRESWSSGRIAPNGLVEHAMPAGGRDGKPVLEVRFKGGTTHRLPVGKMYKFTGTP